MVRRKDGRVLRAPWRPGVLWSAGTWAARALRAARAQVGPDMTDDAYYVIDTHCEPSFIVLNGNGIL